jgi:hypothetical protein
MNVLTNYERQFVFTYVSLEHLQIKNHKVYFDTIFTNSKSVSSTAVLAKTITSLCKGGRVVTKTAKKFGEFRTDRLATKCTIASYIKIMS